MQKYKKNYLEMIALSLLEADFKFLNIWRLKNLSCECNVLASIIFKQQICLLFFRKSAFGVVVFFFTQGRLFSLNGRLSRQASFFSKVYYRV